MQQSKIKKIAIGQTTVLNASLMWFSIGLVAMLSVAGIFGFIPQMQDVAIKLFASRGFIIGLSFISIGLMIGISFGARKAKMETLIFMFIAFALVEGFSLSMVLMRFAFKGETGKILLLLLIPSLTMLGMGYLGYNQIFDFSKIGRFLIFSLIGLMLSGVIMIFIPGVKKMWTLYSIVGYGIFTLYVGFDLWRISRLDDMLKITNNPDKSIVLRYGLIFGLSLLIDFIQLVWFLARLLLDN
ncbi:MAG: hypothetical protein GY679_02655 [Mycoplasma sp.]|nr:hypothetical protein [Mycoplasma sp.]